MIKQVLCRFLIAAVLLLFHIQVSNANEGSLSSSEFRVVEARTLFEAGMFEEAMSILRALAQQYPNRTDILFLVGLTGIENSRRPDITVEDRGASLDDAITALLTILANRPELVRVRLELARAFFFKGEDSLARSHFERVLGGRPA